MKNINKIFNTITISIVVLVGIGLLGTFFSDYLISIKWFGDYSKITNYYDSEKTYIKHCWGARHYWYNWGVFLLFITATIRAVSKIAHQIVNP